MRSRLLDVTDAARQLGIAPKTLYKWVEGRQVPFVRIGRLVRFRQLDLDEWVARRVELAHIGSNRSGIGESPHKGLIPRNGVL